MIYGMVQNETLVFKYAQLIVQVNI
jgi:hypothetical protein